MMQVNTLRKGEKKALTIANSLTQLSYNETCKYRQQTVVLDKLMDGFKMGQCINSSMFAMFLEHFR